jgi:creatinine amidohydrolase
MFTLEHLTMTEFKKHLRHTKTIVFPFGTVEEHGSHLPLHTDSLIIIEALKVAGERKKFFLAPVLPYGVCTSTKDHPGTVSITPGTLRRIATDLVIEGYKKGLKRFLLVSGHGGSLHMSALKESAERLVEMIPDIRIAVMNPYDSLWKELSELAETPHDSHAGELETSMVLHLSPDLVKGRADEEYPAFPRTVIARDKVRQWPGGVWGNPHKATADKGRKALALIAEKIVEVLRELERHPG